MEYCLGDPDGSATMWTAPLDTDVDGDGLLDAVGLDVDGDGSVDDALADLDGDGVADHAVLDGLNYFTDDGSGTWAVIVDRGEGCGGSGWMGSSRWAGRRSILTAMGSATTGCSMSTATGWRTARCAGRSPTSTPTATGVGTSS